MLAGNIKHFIRQIVRRICSSLYVWRGSARTRGWFFWRISENSVASARTHTRPHSLSYIFNYVGQHAADLSYSFIPFCFFFASFFFFLLSPIRLLSALSAVAGGGGWISVASRIYMPGLHNLATRRLAEPIRSSAVRRKVEIYSRADEISRRNELCRFIGTKMTIL